MFRITKLLMPVAFVAILLISMFCISTSALDDSLKIHISTSGDDVVTAQVGDIIKYSIYMSDTTEDVVGVKMSGFYDKEYLSIVENSFITDSFSNSDINDSAENCYTFFWTDVKNPTEIHSDTSLFSIEFKVEKVGETDLSYFITDIYGDDMTYLKSYTITCSVSVNGTEEIENVTPIVNADCVNDSKFQGGFVNYIDGMGEENTPNKSSHEAVKTKNSGESETTSSVSYGNDNSSNTKQFKHVTVLKDGMLGSGGDYTRVNVLVVGIIILAVLSIIILVLKIRSHRK